MGERIRVGVALGRLHPAFHVDATLAAERLGFESVWLPEHLVFPVALSGSPWPGADHPPVPPETPVFDAFAYLSYLAGRTSRIRLGTHVYLMALRHPFVAARAVQTLDHVSGGRAEVGVGAGWLASEWQAAGLDFRTRGRRLDEAIAVCKRLWSEPVVEHHGEFFDFGPVRFEPKPTQRPWPPIHVGGESDAALRRAARVGEGWIGLDHDAESVRAPIARLHALRERRETADGDLCITVGSARPDRDALARLADAGVDRVIVCPWRRSREAVAALEAWAEATGLAPAAL